MIVGLESLARSLATGGVRCGHESTALDEGRLRPFAAVGRLRPGIYAGYARFLIIKMSSGPFMGLLELCLGYKPETSRTPINGRGDEKYISPDNPA